MTKGMQQIIRILIIEDDMLIAANISMQLTKLGYEVTGILPRGEDALMHVKKDTPDILLLDINLKGRLNGIETARTINSFYNIPVIYLTANNDEATFTKAKETQPWAFITKPFNKLNLQRTIALVVEKLKEEKNNRSHRELQVLSDRVFVRSRGKMTKLLLNDIQYIEADRNYCTLVTEGRNYVLTSTLKSMEEQLPKSNFLRVHRSFMVNISKLDVVAENHLEIKRKVIPISKSYKEFLMGRIQTL